MHHSAPAAHSSQVLYFPNEKVLATWQLRHVCPPFPITVALVGEHSLLLLNPPFFARHMESIVPTLHRLLGAGASAPPQDASMATESHEAPTSASPFHRVTALVVVPGEGERRPYEVPHLGDLLASPYTRAHTTIPAGEHVYCHGLAHQRTRRIRTRHLSRYDTNVYVLSSHAEPPSRTRNFQNLVHRVSVAFRESSSAYRLQLKAKHRDRVQEEKVREREERERERVRDD